MIVILCVSWLAITYLACKIAYKQGRKDKWEEIAREYICFHKSVKIQPSVVSIEWKNQYNKPPQYKPLTKTEKNATLKKVSNHKKETKVAKAKVSK